jgi:hypothetical protein
MAYCLLYFHQLVTMRSTQSYNHFAGHYKFVIEPAETLSAGSLTNLKLEYIDFLGKYEAICETALGSESGP